MAATHVVRIRPQEYIHILDQTTNITRVEVGPNTLICKQHEEVVAGPLQMITIPPRHYIEIINPVLKREDETIVFDDFGQAELRWGENEIRLPQEPFPLYPGEKQSRKGVSPLEMVYKNHALHLRCVQDFEYDSNEIAMLTSSMESRQSLSISRDDEKLEDEISIRKSYKAGDEWLFEGPAQYVPNVNVEMVSKVEAIVIKQNEALKLVARQDCVDREDNQRIAGEQWLVRKPGAYLPSVYEKPLNVIKAKVLTDKKALHMRALKTFRDSFGQERKNGEEWLITSNDTETYIPSVHEQVVKVVKITTLSSRQYCVIVNPYDQKKHQNQYGAKQLIVGEKSFFLYPGETLQKGIESVYVLNEEQGLVLSCTEAFEDKTSGKTVVRRPGDRWMIRGPMEFIPPIGAKVLRTNRAISLGKNEGIYVRNIKTGKVRAVIGQTYLLNENEQLWEKHLPREMEELLASEEGYLTTKSKNDYKLVERIRNKILKRDRTRVVKYNVPHNHCVHVVDYRQEEKSDDNSDEKDDYQDVSVDTDNNLIDNINDDNAFLARARTRVEFGPCLVLLEPGELITCLTLSGGKPKSGNYLKCLHLRLGPEFSSDIIHVETSDHAALTLSLSYNWHFERPDSEPGKLFSVQDFIGLLCKTVSSRIRAAVSAIKFDEFHTRSSEIIYEAVFGKDYDETNKRFYFPENHLVLTGIDVRSIEPVDPKTRDALLSSAQTSIEHSAKLHEQKARFKHSNEEEKSKGALKKQKLNDQIAAEKKRRELIIKEVQNKKQRATREAEVEATAKATSMLLAARGEIKRIDKEAEALQIQNESKVNSLRIEHQAELDYLKQQYDLRISHQRALANIEVNKFREMCDAIGKDTLKSIALAPPELRAKLLNGLAIDQSLLKGGSIPFVDLQ